MWTPCSRAWLVVGSLIAVALISPARTAASRLAPPPYSFTVTSARVMPKRSSASVTVESLSEPMRAHADHAALEVGRGLHARRGRDHEADHVAHRCDQPQVAAGAVGLHHRRHADPHQVDVAGLQFLGAAGAAAHVDDLDLEPVGGIEAAFLRHPHRQHGVDGVGDADAERDELLGGGGEGARSEQRRESDAHEISLQFLHAFLVVIAVARMERSEIRDGSSRISLRSMRATTRFRTTKTPGTASRIPGSCR